MSDDEQHLRTALQEATATHQLAPGAAGRALRAVSRRRRAGVAVGAMGVLGVAGGFALTGVVGSGASKPSAVSVAASASPPAPEPAVSTAAGPAPTTAATANPGNPGAAVPALPALGAANYPLASYPAPVRIAPGTGNGSVQVCPNPVGLQTPTAASVNAAVADERRSGTISLADDLAHTDRAWWPELVPWQRNPTDATAVPILHAAALQTPIEGLGVPDPAQWIGRSCGVRTEQLSILVISGPADGPALQEALVYIQRGGRVLLYFTYP